jgi:hypothetical protein
MRAKYKIVFNYMDFSFIGEVSKQLIDQVSVYNVVYVLAANQEAIAELEIYRGSGPRNGIYWRQRISTRETILIDPDLVEIIGEAIKIQEDIESR